jgi:hypothetical protein
MLAIQTKVHHGHFSPDFQAVLMTVLGLSPPAAQERLANIESMVLIKLQLSKNNFVSDYVTLYPYWPTPLENKNKKNLA